MKYFKTFESFVNEMKFSTLSSDLQAGDKITIKRKAGKGETSFEVQATIKSIKSKGEAFTIYTDHEFFDEINNKSIDNFDIVWPEGKEPFDISKVKIKTKKYKEKIKTITRRQYEKILKGAMEDAAFDGNEEHTYDMAQNLIYDEDIKKYLIKTEKTTNMSKLIQRLQWDLEAHI